MAKIILDDLVNLQNQQTAVATINSNNAILETAIDNTLSRDGTAPNQMEAPFDMNGEQIINLPEPLTANSPLRLQDLSDFVGGGTVASIPDGGTTGQSLVKASNADYDIEWSAGGSGTVTSVGLSMPAEFSVSGSPVTGSGTLTASKANQNANIIYAGPSTGAAAAPTFRALVDDDIPALALTGDVGGNTGATVIGANKVTNAMLATASDSTVKSNISGGVAVPSDNTITAVLDKQLGTTQGNVAYRNAASWVSLAPGTNGQVLTSGGAAANVSWTSAAGSGTVTSVTPGTGLTSTITAAAPGSAITSTGTLSVAHIVNPQSGTSYAIADSDRGKLITGSNAAAQAYSIAQAGAASAFQSGWFTDILNKSTNVAGIITVTPTTSTINGASTYKIQPGQYVRIVSDGTQYQVWAPANASQLPGTATNDAANAGNIGEYVVSNVALGAPVALTNGVAVNVTSISLTAGDWDLSGMVGINGAATTTVGTFTGSISQTSATQDIGNGHAFITYYLNTAAFAQTALQLPVPPHRISLNATTTIYLVASLVFGTSTAGAYGNISARRVR